MDYKKEIIEMLEKIDNICWLRSIYVQKINDDSLLEFFYRFIARVLRNRGY